nr:unnamed protein product [Callosobruchus analis]
MSLDDHVVRKHPDFISSITNKLRECTNVPSKQFKNVEKSITFRKQRQVINEAVDSESFSCYICSYSAFSKHHLIDHMIVHDSEKYGPDYSERDDCHANMSHETVSPGVCSHCDASFRDKRALDDHVLKKHPNFISSITSKIHRCPECHYATVRNVKKSIIFRKQREVINEAVDRESFSCYICSYSAFSKHHLIDHMIVHDNEKYGPDYSERDGCHANMSHETVSPGVCSHCDASFRDKRALDDHVLKKHPNFISSITSRIHRCPECHYATVRKMKVIYEAVGSKSFSCYICSYTASSKHHLTDHISAHDKKNCVITKLYECTEFTFKTTVKRLFERHLSKHPEVASDTKLSTCIHCKATFKEKSLEKRIISRKQHQVIYEAIVSETFSCYICIYTASTKDHLIDHMSVHDNKNMKKRIISRKQHEVMYETVGSKSFICYICNHTAFNKHRLIDHMIVHDNEKYIPGHSKRDSWNVNTSNKTVNMGKRIISKKQDQVVYETVDSKSFSCYICNYTAFNKHHLIDHMIVHDNEKYRSDANPSNKTLEPDACSHCDTSFSDRRALDEHVLKRHLNCVSSIASKIYRCPKCHYKTVRKDNMNVHIMKKRIISRKQHHVMYEATGSETFSCYICNYAAFSKHHLIDHMIVHDNEKYRPDANPSNKTFEPDACSHCDASFRDKRGLDDHVLKKHPDFILSVTSQLHECTKCTYKTTVKSYFDKHLGKHPGFAFDSEDNRCVHCKATFQSTKSLDNHVVEKHPNLITPITKEMYRRPEYHYKTVRKSSMSVHYKKGHKLIHCVHCNATFIRKSKLDEHIIRKHPDFMASVTSQFHACTKCTFKTTSKSNFEQHLRKHPGLASDFKHSPCMLCNATFRSKKSLDDHVVEKHPNLITPIKKEKYSRCPECRFKSVRKTTLDRHMLRHSATERKLIHCRHCNAQFKTKLSSNEHIIRKHPDFISSVTIKLHECTKCHFKTVIKRALQNHLSKHAKVAPDFERYRNIKLIKCTHCNATFEEQKSLDNHKARRHPEFVTYLYS